MPLGRQQEPSIRAGIPAQESCFLCEFCTLLLYCISYPDMKSEIQTYGVHDVIAIIAFVSPLGVAGKHQEIQEPSGLLAYMVWNSATLLREIRVRS